jgi:hypothetical protein
VIGDNGNTIGIVFSSGEKGAGGNPTVIETSNKILKGGGVL